MYVRKSADRRAKKPLRTYWSADVLGRSPLQCHSCQRWKSFEVPEPWIVIEKQLTQAFLKTMPKVARPTASKWAVLFREMTRKKQLAGSVLPCVFWNLWVGIRSVHNRYWGPSAYGRLHHNRRMRVWTTRWTLCPLLSYFYSVIPIQLSIHLSSSSKPSNNLFWAHARPFFQTLIENSAFCLARITPSSHSSFSLPPSFSE